MGISNLLGGRHYLISPKQYVQNHRDCGQNFAASLASEFSIFTDVLLIAVLRAAQRLLTESLLNLKSRDCTREALHHYIWLRVQTLTHTMDFINTSYHLLCLPAWQTMEVSRG